jgi:hypothetical protein
MGLFDKIKSMFRSRIQGPPDAPRLKAESVNALASALKLLRVGEHGWITLREAWHLFSRTDDQEEAFGELDDEGGKQLEEFAAQDSYRSDFTFMPVEGRLYFTRK